MKYRKQIYKLIVSFCRSLAIEANPNVSRSEQSGMDDVRNHSWLTRYMEKHCESPTLSLDSIQSYALVELKLALPSVQCPTCKVACGCESLNGLHIDVRVRSMQEWELLQYLPTPSRWINSLSTHKYCGRSRISTFGTGTPTQHRMLELSAEGVPLPVFHEKEKLSLAVFTAKINSQTAM
eukprot:gb/GECG01007157.1/.p1 GENE.gb/GECG01007157.1/~~gb/GECG01007157.1/.p1  ORF type:complete len:180 (+),score=10.62 gb/GECG01007157.1/:1-540(+)